jgi:hypothetical protein
MAGNWTAAEHARGLMPAHSVPPALEYSNLSPEYKMNLWGALLLYCRGSDTNFKTEDSIYTVHTSMCGTPEVLWTARVEEFISHLWLVHFNILVISMAKDF